MIAQGYAARARRALLVGLASLALPAALSAASVPDDDPPRVTLTARDVEASNREVASAYRALVDMWTREFRELGTPFRAPRVVAYRGTTRTACGVVPASNALYCLRNNTIYFDEVFLAAQSKIAGSALGTDGDMASVGIIAHEMGHSVALQLGRMGRDSYRNEAIADCFAGAFARHSEREGMLEDGDTEEAFFAMAAAADPELRPTGNERLDRRLEARLQQARHGTRAQRQANFRLGLERGSQGCLTDRFAA
ncbi:MAG TPA: neutral zinc metallopeptidase [Gemmatimonadaceae bacterium]|nr:neutral zinc metallopeptidase [Gemmatimonadaceae bacterium]